MFFRKKKAPKLVDIVPKVTHTDYVFNNIMGDLGHACEDINRSTPLMMMAYAYARRTAAAAMYIQGLYDRDTFTYVQSMFVNYQCETDGSVKFQETAAAESDEFMQTYSTQINGLLSKGLIMIAREYDVSGNQLDDADLFREVIDTIHHAQKEAAIAGSASDTPRAIKHGQKCAKSICEAIDDIAIIMQLILEDIESASMGNDKAKSFAKASGIPPSQFRGALNNSRPEVDGPKGVKTYLDEAALQYYPDLDQMADFRLAATEYIVQHYGIGKFSR